MKQQCPDCASGGVFGVGNGKCSKCYGGGKAGTIADDIAGGEGLVLAVDNRKRNFGIWVDRELAARVRPTLEIAVEEHRGSRGALINRLRANMVKHVQSRPTQ